MSPEVLAGMVRAASPEQLAVALGVLVDLDSGYEGWAADGENPCPLCNGLDEHDETCVLGRVRAALEPIEAAEEEVRYGHASLPERRDREAEEDASHAAAKKECEKMRLANQIATWNAMVPPGTRVAYRRVVGDSEIETRTRSKAWALGHGAGVVLLEGEVGGWCLDFVRAVPTDEPPQVTPTPDAARVCAADVLTRSKLERLHGLLGDVLHGLEGKPFGWGDGQRAAWVPLLAEAGVELITRTALEKRGHRLKRGAGSVGQVYFGAPIKRTAPVFVLGVQTVLLARERAQKADRAAAEGGAPS